MDRMAVCAAAVVMLLVLSFPVLCAGSDPGAPKVVGTNPRNGAQDVDPALQEISVTFSEPMMDKSWSWAFEEKDRFPEMTGRPYYTDNLRTCVLPVSLKTGKEYVVWINTERLRNFRSAAGIPAIPYKLTFRTK